MKYKSLFLQQASGSVSGCTWSRNRYGQYVRNRTVPVNPNTDLQNMIRSAFGYLATRWNQNLTDAQRDGWNAYAAAVPRIGPLGDTQFTTGINWYIACNSAAKMLTTTRGVLDDAPTMFNMASLSSVSISAASAGAQTVTIEFNNTDEWAIATGGLLLVQCGIGVNPTRNFYKGPFQFNPDDPAVAGDTTTPPTTGVDITPFTTIVEGQRIYARFVASNADGRISPPQIAVVTVGA